MSAVFSFSCSNATHNRKRTSIEFIQTSYKQVLFTCKRKNWEKVVNALLKILKTSILGNLWFCLVSSRNRLPAISYLACAQQTHFRSSLLSLRKIVIFQRENFLAFRRLSLTFLCKVIARETVDQASWRSHRTCRILREKADCKQSSDERDGMERRKIVIFAVIYHLIKQGTLL